MKLAPPDFFRVSGDRQLRSVELTSELLRAASTSPSVDIEERRALVAGISRLRVVSDLLTAATESLNTGYLISSGSLLRFAAEHLQAAALALEKNRLAEKGFPSKNQYQIKSAILESWLLTTPWLNLKSTSPTSGGSSHGDRALAMLKAMVHTGQISRSAYWADFEGSEDVHLVRLSSHPSFPQSGARTGQPLEDAWTGCVASLIALDTTALRVAKELKKAYE